MRLPIRRTEYKPAGPLYVALIQSFLPCQIHILGKPRQMGNGPIFFMLHYIS
jgi:hypothetical protein